MPKIIYIAFDDHVTETEVPVGNSVMEGAIEFDVEGIVAECGGSCSCATCHVYVDPDWFEQVGSPGPLEDGMLEAVDDRRPTSRLSCQIKVTEEVDGMVVRLPESQI